MQFLSRLRLWQKLTFLVIAMAIPTALVGVFYLSMSTGQVSQARAELEGARYLDALGNFSSEIVAHHARAFMLLSGDASRKGEVLAEQEEVDKRVAAVDALDGELGKRFNVSENWGSLKSEWSVLKSKTLQQSADDSDAAHAALMSHIQQLGELVSAHTGMSSDPDVNTRTLIHLASDYAPTALNDAGNMRLRAVRAAIKGYLGGDDRMGIQIFHERVVKQFATMNDEVESLAPDARTRLAPVVGQASSASAEFFAILGARILNAAEMKATGSEIYDAGVAANRAISELCTVSYDSLRTALKERASALALRRAWTSGISVIALALAVALSWLITQSLARPLTKAVSVFGRISEGHYDNQIDASATDEAGQVLRALVEMQGKLRSQIETERAVAAENTRIRQALDRASTSVVLADGHHQIVYLNDAAQASFTRNQPEIRKVLPAFDAARLRGSTLESLAADPAQQRRILDTLTGADVQERVLGEFTFKTVTNPVLGDSGERLGTVMEWTQRTQEVRVEKELQGMLAAVNGGDLSKRIDLAGKAGFFEAMSRGINQLADNMLQIVAQVKDAAVEVFRGAQEISAGNSNLSMRTEEQASSLEETASSMEQMTSTVKQNADNANQANQLAIAAREQAEQGGSVVGKAVNAMAGIDEAAKKIADIIGVIDEIAFQTNLLALNAAVEAARAGEQGRGFAVVASEVRNLAGRSASAAKEIKDLIQDSVRKVSDGSSLVTQSGHTLEQIVTSVKKVSDIVAEIAAASREQSSGIDQVGRAVMQMDELTQQNAALVEEATAASQALAGQSGELNQLMARFSIGAAERPRAEAPPPRPAQPQPARSERRNKPKRTWKAQAEGAAGAGGAKSAFSAAPGTAPPVVRKAAGDDSEWQEF
jgi:methyl-accepting chemotaxis protein